MKIHGVFIASENPISRATKGSDKAVNFAPLCPQNPV